MFDYEVMTEEQALAQRYTLLKEGEYDAMIIHSEDKVSSSGNPMMVLTLTIEDDFGGTHDLKDYLVFMPKTMWKVIHCAESAGIINEYNNKKLCSTIIMDRNVRVKIGIEEGQLIPDEKLGDRPKGSTYSPKNKIIDYVKFDRATSAPRKKIEVSEDLEDDVPF